MLWVLFCVVWVVVSRCNVVGWLFIVFRILCVCCLVSVGLCLSRCVVCVSVCLNVFVVVVVVIG